MTNNIKTNQFETIEQEIKYLKAEIEKELKETKPKRTDSNI